MKFPVRFSPLLLLAAYLMSCAGSGAEIVSPDKNIKVTMGIGNEGLPYYTVNVKGEALIDSSGLGIVTDNNLFTSMKLESVEKTSFSEKWTSPWGENKEHLNEYNEMVARFSKTDGQGAINVRFRVFNDGMAFRYELDFPDSLVVTDEVSQFNFAVDGQSWSIAGNFETYELPYRIQKISEVENANTPFTFKTDNGVFGSVHEAALYDYPEMVLVKDGEGRSFVSSLAPLPDGVKAYIPGKFTSPWRTVQIGGRAVDLINSSMIQNLNEPSKIADTNWIKPQKYIGVWWGMHLGTQTWDMGPRHGATTANAIKYIDFAAANNIQGVLFEGWNQGWENWGGSQHFDYVEPYADFDLDSIAAYAASKGIELWMHNETGGNIPEYEAEMKRAMERYAELGIHTLKTGYAGGFKDGYYHHSQYGVRHYQNVVETAAQYEIMIDAHEPIKDTGIRRTWPNMMTREGARGMEWNAWSEGNSSEYLTILPYVRLLGGPMDYTPGIFDLDYSTAKEIGITPWNGDNSNCSIKTTLARQIANWVIIYSPLQMASDLIENYEGHPAFQFFRDYDADSEWSSALQGEIGDFIVVARKAGDRYFLGAGTDENGRTVTQTLDFLQPDVTYKATVYADDVNSTDPEKYIVYEREVTSADTLTLELLPDGGAAVTFLPIIK